jgi:sodium/potassium-transporting ATPase subunit alpha
MKAITAFFSTIIICQVANVLVCRTRTRSIFEAGLFKNKLVLVGIAISLFILANIIYNPYVNHFYGTHPLTLFELSLALPFALLIFFGDELIKLLARKGNVFVQKYLSW